MVFAVRRPPIGHCRKLFTQEEREASNLWCVARLEDGGENHRSTNKKARKLIKNRLYWGASFLAAFLSSFHRAFVFVIGLVVVVVFVIHQMHPLIHLAPPKYHTIMKSYSHGKASFHL